MRLLLLPMMLMFALTGCATGPYDAPPTAEFGELQDVLVPWFACLIDEQTGLPDPNCVESDPVIFPLSVTIRDSETTLPINNVRVTFTSLWPDIYVMPQSVLEAVVIPDTENWQQLDSGGEVFAQFSGDFEGDYRPTYHDTWTDQAGRARTWVYVNSMPTDALGQVTESTILVDMGLEALPFKLQSSG